MIESDAGSGGEAMDPENVGNGGPIIGSDPLTEVTSTGATLTFGSAGTTVDVSVDIPVNDPAMENLSVSGSSSTTQPSTVPGDELAASTSRPSSGTLGRNGNACTAIPAYYYVQLKFWYAGQDRSTIPATVLSGRGNTTGSITLS